MSNIRLVVCLLISVVSLSLGAAANAATDNGPPAEQPDQPPQQEPSQKESPTDTPPSESPQTREPSPKEPKEPPKEKESKEPPKNGQAVEPKPEPKPKPAPAPDRKPDAKPGADDKPEKPADKQPESAEPKRKPSPEQKPAAEKPGADRKPEAKPAPDKQDKPAAKPSEEPPPQPTPIVEDPGAKKPVASLTLSIKLMLMTEPSLFPHELEVALDGHKAVLSGAVASDEEKTKAAELAKSVDGVESVVNKLTVNPALRAAWAKKQDETITQLVKDRLSRSETLKAVGFDVKTENGVVSLSGKTRFQVIALEAAEAARHVPGVRSVNTSSVLLTGKD